jgi:basic amino acid/polyamine antiporter, APA family
MIWSHTRSDKKAHCSLTFSLPESDNTAIVHEYGISPHRIQTVFSKHLQRKSLHEIEQEDGEHKDSLRRSLSAFSMVLMGVGGIIGAGIFVLTGQAAALYAGPAVTISFALSGLACVFAGLCYAELSSMIPRAGSAYTYAFASFGQIFAWIIGWDLILEYLFGAATVAVGWSGYVASFCRDHGFAIPPAFASAPFAFSPDHGWTSTGALFNFPAALVMLGLTIILVYGIRETSFTNNVIVVVKVAVLMLFIIFGFRYINPENMIPYIPPNTGEFGSFGWSGIFRGSAVVFFAYIGFDSVSTLAQEAKNPRRDVPIGILGSLLVSTIFYLTVAFVLTGMVHYSKLSVPDPMAVAVDSAGESLFWLRGFIKVGAICGLTSCILLLLLGQSRILYAMSRDRLLPPMFSKVHPRYKTPIFSTFLSGFLGAAIAGFLPIGLLGELVSIGTLFAFILVCLGVLVLRYTNPDAPRAFKTPLVWPVALAGTISAAVQMASLPSDTWLRLAIWMGLGLLLYCVYGAKTTSVRGHTGF